MPSVSSSNGIHIVHFIFEMVILLSLELQMFSLLTISLLKLKPFDSIPSPSFPSFVSLLPSRVVHLFMGMLHWIYFLLDWLTLLWSLFLTRHVRYSLKYFVYLLRIDLFFPFRKRTFLLKVFSLVSITGEELIFSLPSLSLTHSFSWFESLLIHN